MAELLRDRKELHRAMGREEENTEQQDAWLRGNRLNPKLYEYLPGAPLGPEILAPGAPKPTPWHLAIEYKYPFHHIPRDPRELYDRVLWLGERIRYYRNLKDSSAGIPVPTEGQLSSMHRFHQARCNARQMYEWELREVSWFLDWTLRCLYGGYLVSLPDRPSAEQLAFGRMLLGLQRGSRANMTPMDLIPTAPLQLKHQVQMALLGQKQIMEALGGDLAVLDLNRRQPLMAKLENSDIPQEAKDRALAAIKAAEAPLPRVPSWAVLEDAGGHAPPRQALLRAPQGAG